MNYNIVGGGLAGCVLASLLPNSIIFEKNKIGGLCADNDNYQDFIHVLHTDNEKVWEFVNKNTTVRPHQTLCKAYVNGKMSSYPPKELNSNVVKAQIDGYSKKMWKRPIPKEALARITTSEDGFFFHNKYEGIPDFSKLFRNLTNGTDIVKQDVRDGDIKSNVILTGAIDEYFNYCYGKLPYRGMQSVHYKSEIGLDGDMVTFSDDKIPYQRLVDYGRLGYKDTWIGVESACDAKHYPIRNEESEIIYRKYKALAEYKGIILAGRLGTYHYMNMDEVILQAMELAEKLNER